MESEDTSYTQAPGQRGKSRKGRVAIVSLFVLIIAAQLLFLFLRSDWMRPILLFIAPNSLDWQWSIRNGSYHDVAKTLLHIDLALYLAGFACIAFLLSPGKQSGCRNVVAWLLYGGLFGLMYLLVDLSMTFHSPGG